jgi:hypothetical protein
MNAGIVRKEGGFYKLVPQVARELARHTKVERDFLVQSWRDPPRGVYPDGSVWFDRETGEAPQAYVMNLFQGQARRNYIEILEELVKISDGNAAREYYRLAAEIMVYHALEFVAQQIWLGRSEVDEKDFQAMLRQVKR